jgi:NAD(P)-dependent dehydrogenase (short-subunit alcohol dehydrogenase family)
MTQRVSLVTGTSSGFGWHTALELARHGDRVFAGMRDPVERNRGAAGRMADAAAAEGLALSVVSLDVTSQKSVDAAVASVVAEAGRVDALVNNAGFGVMGPWELATLEQGKHQLDTNLFGCVRMSKAVIPHMRAQRAGWIVNVGSEAGLVAVPFEGYYTCSKFALVGLTQTMRFELSQFGIRVVYLVPGAFMDTRFGDNAIDLTPEAARDAGPYQPLARHMSTQFMKWVTTVTGEEFGQHVATILDDPDPPCHVHAGADEWRIRPRSVGEAEADIMDFFELHAFMYPWRREPAADQDGRS